MCWWAWHSPGYDFPERSETSGNAMSRILGSLLFLLLACGCARQGVGLADVAEARRGAEAFMLHAEVDAVIRHMESGMITGEEEKAFHDFAKRWKLAQLREHPARTETRTLAEFEEDRKKFQKGWPVEMPYTPVQWAHPPEVVFVFYFETKGGKEPLSGMYFVGAYRRDGLWYFTKQI
jgi:hypothetical protein